MSKLRHADIYGLLRAQRRHDSESIRNGTHNPKSMDGVMGAKKIGSTAIIDCLVVLEILDKSLVAF